MDLTDIFKLLFLFTLSVPALGDTITCGSELCQGHSPYCCILDTGDVGCCWDTFVYQLWWFWFIWVIVFFMILGCSLACWRRRQRRYRYVVMANSEYPTYGTVVHTAPVVTTGPYGAQGQPGAGVPAGPPTYANKPPPYSG